MSSLFRILFFSFLSYSVYAASTENFPNEFTIKGFECATRCMELQSKNNEQRIGVFVSDSSKKGTFLFKDEQDQPQIIIKFVDTFLSARIFNTYDNLGRFLGRVTIEGNPITAGSAYSLGLYELDGKTFKATAQSNTVGTTHGFYEGYPAWGKQKLVSAQRPFLSLKTDSDIIILNHEKLFSILDPNLFAALSAFYSVGNVSLYRDPQFQALQTKVQKFIRAHPGAKAKSIDLTQFKAISMLLNGRFQDQYQNVVLSIEEKTQKFVDFTCDLIQSHELSLDEETAAVQYLKQMMYL